MCIDAGVPMRGRTLTDEEKVEAIRLSGTGLSLASVGEILGYTEGSIWQVLRRAAVQTRDTHGRER